MHLYFTTKIDEVENNAREKDQNLRRLEAQRNDLNARVRLLRQELQLLQEPGSYVGEVVKALGTCLHSGLSNGQAARLRAEWGENALAEEEPKALLRLIAEQFDDLLVKILVAAAVVLPFLCCADAPLARLVLTGYDR